MLDVSIIIVAWNVRELLHNCLNSVFNETEGISFEVIYVDNASGDGSIEMVLKDFPKVKIIRNKKNEGFIRANNQGIEISKGRYVLLLNSDTVVLDNAIAKVIKFADNNPKAAIVGCRILNPDGTLQRSCFMYPSILNMFLSATYLYRIFLKSKFFGREMMTWWDFSCVREVETVKGCFSLVRKKAIEQVGLMDETYFVYGDDPDWCCRFKMNGWKIIFMPDSQVIHYGGATTKKQMSEKFILQLYGSKLIFMKKFGNRLTFPLACFLTALFFFFRIPFWLIKGLPYQRERSESIETVKTYLIGGFYCLTDWKRLLMNRKEVGEILHF
jgi:GT2 family glycosyltransferase